MWFRLICGSSDDERPWARQRRGAGHDALAGREHSRPNHSCGGGGGLVVVRVEEARRNNAASMTPTAVANVICNPKRREKKAPQLQDY